MAILLTAQDGFAFSVGYEGYKAADEADDTVDPNIRYFGFLNRRGEWFILKQTINGSTSSYRFVKGDENYTTAWTARQSQTFDYFNEIFK